MSPPPTDSSSRATILRALSEWPSDDLARLATLISLGRPAEVVTNGPPVIIEATDNWGGRMGMAGERERADALCMWRGVSRMCGLPMKAPHDGEGKD